MNTNYDEQNLRYGLDILDSLKKELEKGLNGQYVAGRYIREKAELLERVAIFVDNTNTAELNTE